MIAKLFHNLLTIFFLLFGTTGAWAGWSLNVGYHNPPGSVIGGNFLYRWTNFAFEAGIGAADLNSNTKRATAEQNVDLVGVGCFNIKYLFGSGSFRPYLQGGIGVDAGTALGTKSSIGIATGDPFGGLGLFMGDKVYGYFSLLLRQESEIFFQAGLGVDF